MENGHLFRESGAGNSERVVRGWEFSESFLGRRACTALQSELATLREERDAAVSLRATPRGKCQSFQPEWRRKLQTRRTLRRRTRLKVEKANLFEEKYKTLAKTGKSTLEVLVSDFDRKQLRLRSDHEAAGVRATELEGLLTDERENVKNEQSKVADVEARCENKLEKRDKVIERLTAQCAALTAELDALKAIPAPAEPEAEPEA